MTDKPIFKTIDNAAEMRKAEGGKYTVYPTYKLGDGKAEYMKDKIGASEPLFSHRK